MTVKENKKNSMHELLTIAKIFSQQLDEFIKNKKKDYDERKSTKIY